jgi:hypothetical protein
VVLVKELVKGLVLDAQAIVKVVVRVVVQETVKALVREVVIMGALVVLVHVRAVVLGFQKDEACVKN